MLNTYHCPRCSKQLDTEGSIWIEENEYPFFQCSECKTRDIINGHPVTRPYQFAVDRVGAPFDPSGD